MARPALTELNDIELMGWAANYVPSLKQQAALAWLGDIASDDATCGDELPFEVEPTWSNDVVDGEEQA